MRMHVRLPDGASGDGVLRVLGDKRITDALRAVQPMTDAEWMGEPRGIWRYVSPGVEQFVEFK